MVPEGVKTEASDSIVTAEFVERHLSIGIESLKQLINDGLTVRHLQFYVNLG
jgi:AMP nucleosidase